MSKERRLSRIFAKDGKSVTLALEDRKSVV